MPEKNAKQFSKTTGGILTGVSTILFIGVLILVQLIAKEHNMRFDLTRNKRFSLSQQTKSILSHLEDDVHAYCFYTEQQEDYETISDLLQQYADVSPKFHYRFVDLDKDPLMAQKYDVIAYETVVLTYKGNDRKVSEPTEKAMTNALLRLTQGENKKKIYFLKLHGELDTESQESQGIAGFVMGLKDANYDVETLNLLTEKRIPEDCSVLVIAGPKQDPADRELEAIRTYLNTGGRLIAFIDPFTASNLTHLLSDYGIVIGNDVILDPNGFQNLLQPIVETYPPHEITKDFNYGTVYHLARSVSPAESPPQNIHVQSIAKTSQDAWVQLDPENVDALSPSFDESNCKKGPVSIAVAVEMSGVSETNQEETTSSSPSASEKKPGKNQGKIVVFGDSDFMTNAFLVTFPANIHLVSNSVHWLTEEKDLIAIPPKEDVSQPLTLTLSERWAAFLIPVVIIPLLIAGFGLFRILNRRKHG